MYSSSIKSKRVLNFRQFSKFCKDFGLKENNLNGIEKANFQIIFTKRSINKNANFMNFIELLFQISKIYFKAKNNEIEDNFKSFLDKYISLQYKKICNKLQTYAFGKIQIFYPSFKSEENPAVILIVKYDDLIKHV